MYINAAKTVTEPLKKSFKMAQMIVQDDLFSAKLNFFLMGTREITPIKLLQVDYADPVNHMDVTKLRVGFVTERALEEHTK